MIEFMGAILTIALSGSAVFGMGIKLVSSVNRNLYLLEKIQEDLQTSLTRTDRLEAWLRHHEISLIKGEVTYQPFSLERK